TVGTDADGSQTMNVFRRRQAGALDPGLAYREIFAASSDGSIEIDDLPRSGAYRTLQSNGVSFPIQVFERNETTETPLDLIQTIWVWRVPENRYVRSEVVDIPAMQIEETQLRELYNAEAGEMEHFLEGPWFRTTGEDLTGRAELAYFDPQTREVVLSRGDTQERFEWLNSYKTLYAGGPGLWINLRNEVLSTVRRQLSITVHGLDTISVSDDGAEYWTGRYQRMTPGIQSSVVRGHTIGTPSFELSGVFRNENDAELLLNRPHFRLRTPDFDWSGGFNVIQLSEPVLELKVTDADATPSTARTRNDGTFSVRYAVGYTEQRSDERLVRRLALEPVELTADGLEHTDGVSLVLEQVLELDAQS
ncbi:MAG: pallilysin-related adhesin, partial [Spirochaetales bacterium]|nr:pallilysin-related adhesin [Spirochaetales bacterium]